MPKEVLKNAFITVNAIDLSNHISSITVNESQDAVEKTAMSDTSHTFMPGLLTFNISVEFYQNFDAGSVDATLRGLMNNAGFTVIVRRDASAQGPTNPSRSCSMILGDYQSINGSVGDASKTSVSFLPAGNLSILAV